MEILKLSGFIVCLKEGGTLTDEERKELAEYLEFCRDEQKRLSDKVASITRTMRS